MVDRLQRSMLPDEALRAFNCYYAPLRGRSRRHVDLPLHRTAELLAESQTARRAQRQPLAAYPHLVAAARMLAHDLQLAAAGSLGAAGAVASAVAHPTRQPGPVVVVGRYTLSRLRDRLQFAPQPRHYRLPVRQLPLALPLPQISLLSFFW